MRRLALALCLLAAPAAAQDIRFSPAPLDACFAAGGWTDCIGAAAQACMEATPGGFSTVGVNACLEQERLYWDDALNAAYQQLRAFEDQTDRLLSEDRNRPSGVIAARDMQRAWIAFRDATCAFETLRWWGGTGANGAFIGCHMRMTGEQTLYLRSMLAAG